MDITNCGLSNRRYAIFRIYTFDLIFSDDIDNKQREHFANRRPEFLHDWPNSPVDRDLTSLCQGLREICDATRRASAEESNPVEIHLALLENLKFNGT